MKWVRTSLAMLCVVIGFSALLMLSGCSGEGGGNSGGGSTRNPPLVISQVSSKVLTDTDNVYATGRIVRIDVQGQFEALDISSGTIRITSTSQRYDSGIRNLTLGSSVSCNRTGSENGNHAAACAF